jgi:hypothetical protein
MRSHQTSKAMLYPGKLNSANGLATLKSLGQIIGDHAS